MKLFLQKNSKFRALGAPPLDPRAPPPDPRVSDGLGFCPQTTSLRRLKASPPDPHWPPAAGGPKHSPPIANFWLRACVPVPVRSYMDCMLLKQSM